MRKLCSGTYRAQQVPNAVILFAEGWHETSGYRAWFEQNMLAVFPPEFILYHEDPTGPVLEVLTPFAIHVAFKATGPVTSVIVHDAEGRHVVSVEQVPDLKAPADAAERAVNPLEVTCVHRAGVNTSITALKDGASVHPASRGLTGGDIPMPFAAGGAKAEADGHGATFEQAFDDAVRNLAMGSSSYPDQLTSVDVVSMGALYGGIAGHAGSRRVRVRGR